MFRWLTDRRRRRILAQPWPDAWTGHLMRNVGAYRRATPDAQARLRTLAQVFIAEKHWEGCGGLTLTDEIRVTIAGQGCVLLLERDHDLFARLVSILVYPSVVVTPTRPAPVRGVARAPLDGGVPIAGEARAGETIVLAWDQVLRGARDGVDGRNVVLHELAHVIDLGDGAGDGTPPLDSRAELAAWAEIASAAFLALRDAVERDRPTGALRDYGATSEAEFFAVATETFFERSRTLRDEQPALYDLLARFYRQDPAARAAD